ncbi:MAG: cohesin domain-containing protein [Patescibacteria group bacterium]
MYVPKKLLFTICAIATIAIFLPRISEAATLYLSSEKKNVAIGEFLTVSVRVDTDESSVNAAQATITFDPSVVSVESFDKTGSIFSFWVEEPVISPESGIIRFVGGTPKGVSGDSLLILGLKLKATGTGTLKLSIGDAVVTASDGKGTNVLSATQGVQISVGGGFAIPPPPDTLTAEIPTAVVRSPTPAKGLPAKPNVRVPLYPDQSKWYSGTGEAIALWEMPGDVIQAAVEITKNPNTDPSKVEPELLTGKTLGTLTEGLHYVHVQFRNNLGWGQIAHYRISIDRTAPEAFEVKMDELATDNPSPLISYSAEDSLSGIMGASFFLDGKYLTTSTSSPFKLPPVPPGKHTLLVRVTDFAENSIEDDINFETLPIPTPTIHFITEGISEGEPIFVSGRSFPESEIYFTLYGKWDEIAFDGSTKSDGLGNWEITIDHILSTGNYFFTITARDARGAQSFPLEPIIIKIKPKTIVSLGFLELGWFEIFVLVVLIILAIGGSAGWYYRKEGRRRSAYETVASRDIDKFAVLISKDLDELVNLEERHDESQKMRADFLIKKMQDTLTKMKKYIGEELRKVR